MQNGWIKLHRKIQDNAIYSNPFMLKLWVHCLLKASHKEREVLIGNQIVKLTPGEFITGRESLANEFNSGSKKSEVISAITLWRWLNNFEKWQMLNIKKTTKYSVVSITNWSEHQQIEQQVNNKRTTSEQQVNTNKNVKNEKNDKKEQYAEFVSMTKEEYEKLVNSKGEPAVKRMVTILDNYKGSTGKKYKSDYRAILNWVVKRYEEENNNQPTPPKLKTWGDREY